MVRGVAYISAAWKDQPMWSSTAGNGWWGDTRVNANSVIRKRWKRAVSPRNGWLHGKSDVLKKLRSPGGSKTC